MTQTMRRQRAKPKTQAVRVALNLDTRRPDAPRNWATVSSRNHPAYRQYLSPATMEALGTDVVAYFEAELIGKTWFIGARLPFDLGWKT